MCQQVDIIAKNVRAIIKSSTCTGHICCYCNVLTELRLLENGFQNHESPANIYVSTLFKQSHVTRCY
jgi:hypothetical protein